MVAAERAFGVTVTYKRGSSTTDSFTAIRSDVEYEVMGGEFGLAIKVTSRDYLLPKSSVVIGGVEVEPRAGDRIVEGGETVEIMPLGDKPAVELQAGGFRYLVHTKKVG